MTAPLAIDLYCGLGGWTEGLLMEGYRVVGFDIERHRYGNHEYPAQLVLQDVRTIDGARFADAALIVASPPCQEFSYMAMPWKRAKQIARALLGQDDFPEGYTGSRTTAELTELFDACFRIQREASAAAGWRIPLVVENVRGAQEWVGRAKWNHGSYYLWGDVPALMPTVINAQKFNPDGTAHPPGSWFAIADSKNRGDRSIKNAGGSWYRVAHNTTIGKGRNPVHSPHYTNPSEHIKCGGDWFGPGDPSAMRCHGSKSVKRKAASALIAKIPLTLSRHIAATYKPQGVLL